TTTARPAVSTTPSARYLACFNRCQATSEYNPICGSDNVNYYNPGRFDCALRCGLGKCWLCIGPKYLI
ncbi:Kaz1-ORFB, partial [Drosophila busckii]